MPITGPIPLPGNAWEELANIPAEIEANRLRHAQAQEAQAKAQESQLFAKLLGGGNITGVSGVNGVSGATPTQGGMPGNQMTMQQAMMLSGRYHLPTQVIEGKLVTPFGIYPIGETPEQKRKADTQKAVAQKTQEATAESAMGRSGTDASIAALESLTDQPGYERIAGQLRGQAINAQPFGLPVGSFLQHKFPKQFSKEDADLASQAEAHYGNIVSNMASNFKGPFKNLVNGIIQRMKPNMGDSLTTQKGKLRALRQLSELANKQEGLISKYVDEGLNPTAAILRATQELMPEFKDIVSSSSSVQTIPPVTVSAKRPNTKTVEMPVISTKTPNAIPERAIVGEFNGKKYVHMNGKWHSV